MPSSILHGEFELVFGGIMSLVRRCEAHTCYGHCVCAPHGQTCESDTLCNDVSTSRSAVTIIPFNTLPEDKILDWSKFTTFTEDKINVN